MRALLSVYDKEGLVELAQGLSDLGWELVASGNTSAKLTRGGHRAHRGGRGDRLARDARRAGQDPPPQDPRRHPGRPLQARAPRRPGGQRDRGHRPRGVEPLPVLVGPLRRADRRRRPDHGARRGQEPRARRHRHLAGRLPRRARGAARRRARCRRPRGAGWPGPPSRTPPPTTRPSSPGSTPAGPTPVGELEGATAADAEEAELSAVLPPTLHLTLERTEVLRYGENPHQRGARYRMAGAASWWDAMVQHGGSPLSYLNLFDGDAAWRLVHELAADAGDGQAAVAIIKHANPCGAAVAGDLVTAYERALECDVAERLRRRGGHRRRRHRRGGRRHRRRAAGRRDHRRRPTRPRRSRS